MEKKLEETKIRFPQKFLAPIRELLERNIIKMKRTEKNISKADPFKDEFRGLRNSMEEDLDEQIGHFDSEIKVGFIKKQIVQLRKALTRMKIGKYGICEKCGKMIDTDRLAAKPETTMCIDCMKEAES
ncbi:MAG: TraR/DksA C4-type zinc finger protein [Candidatus Shapirobacteria bacterium]|nr:TraR/DksA C4-type zinc finger protein [Candidatus Shapirobacteria bacterium]